MPAGKTFFADYRIFLCPRSGQGFPLIFRQIKKQRNTIHCANFIVLYATIYNTAMMRQREIIPVIQSSDIG